MKRIIDDVIPVGTPWGGPESRTYLSSFISMLMAIDGATGAETELHARHERLYHLYLTAVGIGVSDISCPGLKLVPHDEIVERMFPDYVSRSMAYAGLTFLQIGSEAIKENTAATWKRICTSIDSGRPVLARSTAGQWSVVTGYDDEASEIIGWDGSAGYWGAPTVQPDRYLDNHMYAHTGWAKDLTRLVIADGKVEPQSRTADVLKYLVAVMKEQRSHNPQQELRATLADDEAFRTMDEERLHEVWAYTNGYIGWYAESRAFVSMTLADDFPLLPDVEDNAPAIECLHRIAHFFGETHDTCWEAWRWLYVKHRCGQPDDAPCRMCGGCLKPAIDEDYAAFRTQKRRHKQLGFLDMLDSNDTSAVEGLDKCISLLDAGA